jgi:hypothetical protein
MSTARLEIVVASSGVSVADRALKQLNTTARETEREQRRMAAVIAEVAAVEEKAAAKAIAAAEKKAAADARAAQKAEAAAARAAERAAALAERKAAQESAAAEKAATRAAERAARQQAVEEKAAQRAAALADKQAAAAARAAQKEADAWNEAKQRALGVAERTAEKQAAAAERAAKREEEAWTRAIQRAKAGLDGVLPIRPSLQRIEAELASKRDAVPSVAAQAAGGAKEGALSALGLGALAGGAAAVAATAVTTLADSVQRLKDSVIADFVADDKLIAQLSGITESTEAASEAFADLERNTLGKLPSTVDEVANAFIQLGNSGLQNGQAALKAYSNIAAQTGASLGTVTNAVQAATLGNYKSLREFGIKVKEEGDSLKVTFRGQTETIAGGADAIEAYMQRLGTVQFAGAVERQMDTVGGAIKKADDAWEKLINTVGDSVLGDAIKSTVGSSVSVIDALTASIDALFGKTQQFKREAESLRRTREQEDKLDATMRSWADPSVSKSETARLVTILTEGSQSSADKALAQYTRNSALIEKLRSLGETRVGEMTLDEAQAELDRQYRRDNGGFATRADYTPKIAEGSQTNYAAYTAMVRKQEHEQFLAVREALSNKENAERESYLKRRDFLANYLGPESEELWSRNEELWGKHLDEIAAKSARKQLELQHRLANIGVGPQSQLQQINNKTAGAYYDLRSTLEENLSGKNGETLKLEAERTYAEKSIAIERERTREIAAMNRELMMQSVQNAEAMFSSLTAALKNSHSEQSAAYRTMFGIQKGFGMVAVELAMIQSMAEASKQPFPANIPLYLKAAAQGAQLLSQMSSLSYSGAYDSGGDVPARSRALGGERGVEIVGPAGVIGREQTAALLSGNRQTRIIFTTENDRGYLGSSRDEKVFVHWIKRNGPLIRSLVG